MEGPVGDVPGVHQSRQSVAWTWWLLHSSNALCGSHTRALSTLLQKVNRIIQICIRLFLPTQKTHIRLLVRLYQYHSFTSLDFTSFLFITFLFPPRSLCWCSRYPWFRNTWFPSELSHVMPQMSVIHPFLSSNVTGFLYWLSTYLTAHCLSSLTANLITFWHLS